MSTLEVWAGIECSRVRVGDAYFDQLDLTGHVRRSTDVDRVAALGVKAVRYPVLWERTVTTAGAKPDWSLPDEGLARLRELGVRPIVGLVHHGSGPRHTSLLDRSFVSGLAGFARAVAQRYPWVTEFTPINEPLTTARFSALYGHWYPHATSDAAFFQALFVECAAIREAMRAIREVTPSARLVQTEDLGTVFSTPRLAYQARFENHRRFLSLDLLTGRVGPRHALFRYIVTRGVDTSLVASLREEPCPPDLIGMNHYITSDRFLDERVAAYPPHYAGSNGRERYADVEAVRVRGSGIAGHRALLHTLWKRYAAPLAITEVHLGAVPEEQIRWLDEAWNAAVAARAEGVDVRAVTAWSAFGAVDWDSLLTKERGHYEAGIFDVRGGVVRPTALAKVTRDLATTGRSDHPLLAEPGWWRRKDRLLYPSFGRTVFAQVPPRSRPVLVTGASGTLGYAIARACAMRGLTSVPLARSELDITDAAAVAAALDAHRPWAVVNAAGYVRVDDAESDCACCVRINAEGAAVVAGACAARKIRYATFSSDLVFDGAKGAPYVEGDATAPLNVYGMSKTLAERLVADRDPNAVIARTSAFFGPWDQSNFVHRALSDLQSGRPFHALSDVVVSPTYVPDLADATLTLLVDGATGLWHLASAGAMTWSELARRAAEMARISTEQLVACHAGELVAPARRPAYCALSSERGALLPSLENALERFVTQWSAHALARAG